MYRLLRCSLTASHSRCWSPPCSSSVLQCEWSELAPGLDSGMASGMALGMASELQLWINSKMASVCSILVAGTVSVLEMEKASGMPSDSKLIGHLFFKEIHIVWLASLLICLLSFVWNRCDSRPGGVLTWLEVWISLCQGLRYIVLILLLAPLVINRPYVGATCLDTRYNRPTFTYTRTHSTTWAHVTVQYVQW